MSQLDGKCRPIQGDGRLACTACLSICEDSFARPLQAIKSKVAEILATYCLDKTPACVVSVGQERRYCTTPEELENANNYKSSILVRSQCLLTEAQGGRCEAVQQPRTLNPDEWSIELGVDECTGGALVRLNDPPPAGAEIFVEFFVQVNESGSPTNNNADGGATSPVVDAAVPNQDMQ